MQRLLGRRAPGKHNTRLLTASRRASMLETAGAHPMTDPHRAGPSMTTPTLVFVYSLLLAAGASGAAESPARTGSQSEAEFFEARVRPVLAEHCFGCHGSLKQKSGLRLDSRARLLDVGDDGPVAIA